jgi:hypothetical protein
MVKIPVPITFNPHKHHFHFLLEKIGQWKKASWNKVEKDLLIAGENLLDFYTGNMTVEEICYECLEELEKALITDRISFLIWLKHDKYRKISISDTSEWIIKQGLDTERYIHIHPAKQSPYTIRVKATTLKTVVALKVNGVLLINDLQENLQKVNEIRIGLLKLSPVKSLHQQKGILKLWSLFEKTEQ